MITLCGRVRGRSTSNPILLHRLAAFLVWTGRTRPSVPFHHLCATRTTRQHSDLRMCRRHRQANNKKRLLHRRARTHTQQTRSPRVQRDTARRSLPPRNRRPPFFLSSSSSFRHVGLGKRTTLPARAWLATHAKPLLQNTPVTPRRHLCGETGGASLLHSASVRKPFLQFVHRSTLNGDTSSSRTARNDAHKRATENDNVVSQRGSARCDVQKRETGNDNVVREHGKC